MVYILDMGDGIEAVFETLELAYNYTWDALIDDGYDPENDTYAVFKDLAESYANKNYDGFYVEDLVWCYAVDYIKE